MEEPAYYTVENGWMETYSGQKFFFENPEPGTIMIEDIGHALGQLCRYGGHSKRFYSVAEHCCILAWWVASQTGDSQLALDALMHDATEAYLVDVPRPIKHRLRGYKEIELRLASLIAAKFGLSDPLPEIVHQADSRVLRDERRQVMLHNDHPWGSDSLEPLNVDIEFWGPRQATSRFMSAYEYLRFRRDRGMPADVLNHTW